MIIMQPYAQCTPESVMAATAVPPRTVTLLWPALLRVIPTVLTVCILRLMPTVMLIGIIRILDKDVLVVVTFALHRRLQHSHVPIGVEFVALVARDGVAPLYAE
jgi:hypothetical protein